MIDLGWRNRLGANDDGPGERDDEGAPTSEPKGPQSEMAGLRVSDLLYLPDPSRRLLKWMLREGEVNLVDIAAGLGWDESTALSVLTGVVAEGFVTEVGMPGDTRYRVRLARQRSRGTVREL